MSPTTSTIKEPGKPVVTVCNSDIAKFGTQLEKQTPLKAYADRRGPRSGEKIVEELIHSHIKECTRKQKGDKKMKHRKIEPGSGVSSQKSNISRAMRGRIPKIPNFSAMRNPQPPTSISEQHSSTSTNPAPAPSNTRTSERTRRSPSYYGFETSPPVSDILPPPKRPRRAVDVEYFAPPDTIIESVQQIAESQPEEQSVSPCIGQVSPPAPRNTPLHYMDTPTLVRSMTALDAEEQASDKEEWNIYFSKNCKTFHIVLIIVFLAMITSTYIVIIYLTGDLVLIYKHCYYLYLKIVFYNFSCCNGYLIPGCIFISFISLMQ